MLESAPAFHNRDQERTVLQEAIHSNRAELVILYGRRGR